MSKSGIERGVELAQQLEGLLGDSKEEVLARLLSLKVAPNLGGLFDRSEVVELTNRINHEELNGLRDMIRDERGNEVVGQIQDLFNWFLGETSNLVAQDIERMGAKLTDLGFPDVRTDHENWRVIAKMVGVNPDDLMEDIFESAVAYKFRLTLPSSGACLSENGQAIPEADDPPPPIPSDYTRLWDYANKKWSKGTDNYSICEAISKGPGNYSDCVENLVPNVDRTTQTRRFHAVAGPLNDTIRVELGLEVYRDGEQVLIREAIKQKTPTPKATQAKPEKKKSPKRKL